MKETKNLCLTAMGIALFVALAMVIRFPVFENYYLCLGYIVMVVYLYNFRVASGTLVGVLGTILYCVLTSGLRGMPGWAAGNIVLGIMIGLSLKATKNMGNISFYAVNSIIIMISTFLGILLFKSLVECLLYSQPMIIRMGKNIYACVADVIVLILGLFVSKLLEQKRVLKKYQST